MTTEYEILEGEDKKKVSRLSNMDSREVSVVDRAANKRKFLVIKRDQAAGDDLEKQSPTKTDGGKIYPAEAYAYVPDPEKPSTWKLRLYESPEDVPSKPSTRITGAAVAALGAGFRGQNVQIPSEDLPKVKQKVRAAWIKARELAGEDNPEADLPTVIKEASVADETTTVDETQTKTETEKRVVGARVEEVLSRVLAIKAAVETAKASEGTEGVMPSALGQEIRAAQLLLKGVAGVTKGILLIPTGSLDEVTEIESAVQKGVGKVLDEVERRLETMKADLADADMVSPNQAREIDGVADLLGKAMADYPSKADSLVVAKSSLDDESRTELMRSIEKAMGELGEVYMALSTDSVGLTKGERLAGEFEIGAVVHDASATLETAVTKMMGDTDRVDLNKAVEVLRSMHPRYKDKVVLKKNDSGDEGALAKAVIGVLTPIQKASQMYKTRWRDGGADVVLATSDEKVASFDSWEEAEMDALKRNVQMVTKVAKLEGEAKKAGRAMKGERLNRLMGAAKMLKDALGDLQAGSLSMEKFKKAADVLSQVISEVQTVKAAQAARGIEDPRSTAQHQPNQGSGVQPDEGSVTDAASYLAGEGTPDLSDVLKSIDGLKKDREQDKTKIKKQAETIENLQGELAKIKKQRSAPATVPNEESRPVKTKKAKRVAWPVDMNQESWA